MKKFFFKYPITKMISLLLAMTLWLMVHGDRQKEITVDVPIKFEDLPGELMTVGAVPQTIRVRLKGSQTRLSKIDDSYFTPHALNLSKARPGINTFWVYEEDFKVPFGVSVMRVYPQAIRLELDFAQIQWVPVEAKLEGDLDLGYTIDQISIVPSKVRIRKKKKKIGEVKTIYTEEISIAG
ncbi:MAG: hypothetical protein KDD52_10015, partial [Bdellovibrionales bacterium]|nr:hypothetical protein [Bdellovibrionales bacterium]